MISEKSYAEQIGYFTIVMEDIRYQVKGVIEEQAAMRTEFNEKLDRQGEKLENEIRITQQAVRANGQEIKELKSEIQRVASDVQRVEKNLTSEIRQVGKTVEKHDEDIVFLKTALMKEPA